MKPDAEVLAEAIRNIGFACHLYVGEKLDEKTLAKMKYHLSDILYGFEVHEEPTWRGDIDIDVASDRDKLHVTVRAKNEKARQMLEDAYKLIDASYGRPHGNDN